MKFPVWLKKAAQAAVCAALLLAFGLCALAEGGAETETAPVDTASTVTYAGGAEKFVFIPEDTDLFQNFKGVMPGDTLEQTIRVQNSTGKRVRIYLRPEPVAEEDVAFLSQMTISVSSGDLTIFEATVDQQHLQPQDLLLGTFKKNGGTSLTVTLSVPIEMGNEFMEQEAIVPWTFIAEEIPASDTPETGDWFDSGIWIALGAMLVVCLLWLLLAKKRNQEEEAA